MLPLKYLILIGFTSIGFFLTLINRDKLAVAIMVFTIPFAAHPFADSDFPILLGLNAFMIWGIWLGMKTRTLLTREQWTSWTDISGKIRFMYYFLLAGIMIPLAKTDYSGLGLGDFTPLESLVNYSLSIVTIIMFVKIMVNYQYDYGFHDILLTVFVSTVFVQFASYVLVYGGYQNLVPRFLLGSNSLAGSYLRFGGLLDDYELIVDYSMILIAFAAILFIKRERRPLAAVCGIMAIMMAIVSATRSFLVISTLFALLVVLFYTFKLRLHRKLFAVWVTIAIVLAISVYAINRFTPADIITTRAEESIYYLQRGDIRTATNRDLVGAIPSLLSKSGFLGVGAFTIYEVNNDAMVYHNLYYAIYANFGVPGLLALLYMLISCVYLLHRAMERTNDQQLAQEGALLLALLVVLIIQQGKISAARFVTSMLIYAFMFVNIYYYRVRQYIVDGYARG